MAQDKKTRRANRIPIRFLDSESDINSAPNDKMPDGYDDGEPEVTEKDMAEQDNDAYVIEEEGDPAEFAAPSEVGERPTGELAGPLMAELVATRAELKRVEAENAELRDRMARRQADFENQRKRTERERAETYNRVVAEIAAKLLPVVDNLKRALDAEASVEASESDEFRHFLSGVDLIYKQLNGVLENLGVKAIPSVGEHFNPHVHEAVVTEPTNEYEPDTVVQEIVTGYRLGDKLIRPALVKVAVRK
ncbi:MAG: nucleotide exchange factor GrpE [Acidobacteria bacterium]|nr:MAG: nucleotide exchange factor GrpE [Acidobacteriota bacterium]